MVRSFVWLPVVVASVGLVGGDASGQSGGGSTARPSSPPLQYGSAQYGSGSQPGSATQGSAAGGSATGGSASGSGGAGSASQGSATQGSAASGSATQGSAAQGSATAAAEVALRGFCPVCLVETKQWIKGSPQFAVVHDGKAYHFPDAQRMQAFRGNPAKYAPALGGDNIVRYARTGQRVPGNLAFGIVQGGRVFFVSAQEERDAFMQNPLQFSNADLALNGDCVVCQVDLGQRLPGSRQITTSYKGVRYQFAGVDQQRKFLVNPMRYVSAPTAAGGGSATRGSATAGSGTSYGGGSAGGSGAAAPAGSGSAGSAAGGSTTSPAGSGSGSGSSGR